MKIQTFTLKGTKVEDTNLPKEFGVKTNPSLLAQAIHVYEERSHIGLRKTKTRSEVLRTTKKVYKQKGTGGARHGSRRAPIFVGGGVALGPRPVRRILNLPNDIKNKSKFMTFALKAEDKEVVFVSGISKLGKTKVAMQLLKSLEKATSAKRFTFVLSETSKEATKALRNLANASYVFYKDANALDIFRGGMIVIDKDIFGEEKKVSKESKIKKEK
ncbi:MAG: ribosomal protein L4/L1e, large subunit ribosomal protein L4 [Microgenomates group bacterium GW2011_GWC1_41_20]|uniref:Large ribosomal subunit protein uL4 n=7 Tax=Candidatus Woeseibacteriota TaxID=1752722 RepID=A0A0G0RU94_9BACT|nr:MAG: 50S ribosomal protein L4 [Candidatus Woesebacteria bacterium GW2011_GWB1_40_12]KKR56249.1 MAG: 50S ribosomal protein L4 [Candidatus Woesebacteria bacterium GW2011_GWF1_40_24]KKR90756.1 MAG: 50S ribosomal protein L4 [Candidatus Woesebacteria bacterium GW2011_GWD1_41_12]KKS00772.1 MAG: ribosomal protein L4/L1e, large subunit ribosomal protein L4 [Microgenomates group bacterium GW2011_GWC1_41_20]KKS05789.1 MAG: 50S ribosomal protein L4 [Candidatus Woesebacteria bacterium GW2011_GWE1_41_24]